jgi:hypothetical protein
MNGTTMATQSKTAPQRSGTLITVAKATPAKLISFPNVVLELLLLLLLELTLSFLCLISFLLLLSRLN